VYGPEESIPAALATEAKVPAVFLFIEPGIEPKDLFRSFPKASVNESPIIPSDKINVSNDPESNAPGTKIYPGDLKKGLDLLAIGKKVVYEGATGGTFTNVGVAEGSFLEKEIKGGKFKNKKQR
jgi:hypothetical protein